MKKIFRAPEEIPLQGNIKTIFLAGSIEMDKAVDWQKHCEEMLQGNYIIFNPRREQWDIAGHKQSKMRILRSRSTGSLML